MNSNTPQVTVLLPVYNGERYLHESIDSILYQTFSDFEFLIIDDGSTDSSRDIILSYVDPRISLIENEENIGLSKSLNRGIQQAKGKYIARQDADDISRPMRIEKEYALMRKGDHDVVYCRYQYIDRRGRRLQWVSPVISSQNLEKALFELKDPIAHGSVLMKKKSVIDVGGYNDLIIFSQDYELWFRLMSMNKKIECVDCVGYYQRLFPRRNKIKKDAQRRYTSMINDYYVNGNKMLTSELSDLHDELVSNRDLQQRYRQYLLQQLFYWFNIKKIQLKALISSHSINYYESANKKHSNIKVLMVTGVYHPEVSGAANQCRQLVNALRGKFSFTVLTTTLDPDLPPRSKVDGVEVIRVHLSKSSVGNYFKAILKFATFFLSRRRDFQIVHLHGYSLKSAFLSLFAKVLNKRVIIKMTSIGHDDPISIRQRGYLLNYFFSRADAFVGMTVLFEELYRHSRLPANRLKQVSNGVDTSRFFPVMVGEKATLRDQLGLPGKMKLILFVGHFSREKCPDILLTAWKRCVAETFPETGIIFVGSTNPDHYEVDAKLIKNIEELAKPYINERIFFIDRTQNIEKYYQNADIFVLPSLREGQPNALLEAMSSGLPVIVSRLEGVTDWVVTDGKNGLLVEPGIWDDLGRAIKKILDDGILAGSLGRAARETIEERFSMNTVAEQYLELYEELVP